MTGMFKSPKIKTPAAAPTVTDETPTEDLKKNTASDDQTKKRKGRSSLRIDLATSQGLSNKTGTNVPAG